MLGMRHVYHVSPFASTPHRSSPGYAHPPPSPWSYEGFRKPENEKSYTIELRTATSLARLWQQQGKREEAKHVLGEVYGWFTEGFDTADLQDTKALLAELGEERV